MNLNNDALNEAISKHRLMTASGANWESLKSKIDVELILPQNDGTIGETQLDRFGAILVEGEFQAEIKGGHRANSNTLIDENMLVMPASADPDHIPKIHEMHAKSADCRLFGMSVVSMRTLLMPTVNPKFAEWFLRGRLRFLVGCFIPENYRQEFLCSLQMYHDHQSVILDSALTQVVVSGCVAAWKRNGDGIIFSPGGNLNEIHAISEPTTVNAVGLTEVFSYGLQTTEL